MADFKPVKVIRDGVVFVCAESEDQLKLFLEAGYTPLEEDKPKAAKKKTTKK